MEKDIFSKIESLNLNVSEEEKTEIMELVCEKIISKLINRVEDEELEKANKIMNEGSDEEINKFLEEKMPDFEEILEEEIENIKKEWL